MGYTDDDVPFNDGSETSEAAAEAQATKKGEQERRILAYLKERGAMGATDDETGAALGFLPQSASVRRRGLVLQGLVENTGTQRATRTGCDAFVWALRGVAKIRPLKPSYTSLVRALKFAENCGRTSVEFDEALQALYARLPKGR